MAQETLIARGRGRREASRDRRGKPTKISRPLADSLEHAEGAEDAEIQDTREDR